MAVLLLTLTSEAARAAPIALTNPSFENPDVTDGQMLGALNPDNTTVPGWGSSFSGLGLTSGGIHDPQDAQYGARLGARTSFQPEGLSSVFELGYEAFLGDRTTVHQAMLHLRVPL